MLSQMAALVDVPRWKLSPDYKLYLSVRDGSSVAWRVNHMCCVLGALAAAFIAASVMVVLGSKNSFSVASSWVASGIFAFSPCKISLI